MASRPMWLTGAAGVLLALTLSACSGTSTTPAAAENPGQPGASESPTAAPVSAAQISSSIPNGSRGVQVNRVLRLDVTDGTLNQVRVVGSDGELHGAMTGDQLSWQSSDRLQPGETYKVVGRAVDANGLPTIYRARFRTQDLTLDQQTYPSFIPQPGSTVGVGMPVIIRFDVAVTDHASIQRHLKVVTKPAQPGAFRWISDHEVHWRPKNYWKPGTKVTVTADIDSVPAGNGIYGQLSRTSSFTIGRSMISKVDTRSDQMRVYENGKLIRTIPITTGRQPEYTTRSGVKVIIEKFRHRRMDSETIGIDPNSADGYVLDDVEYAMRLTYSGEFLHAAPWSVASQGVSNVSHGCTGMSTANAGWLYDHSIIGDVVEYVGTDRPMTLTNGFGDWNLPFREYRSGSAA